MALALLIRPSAAAVVVIAVAATSSAACTTASGAAVPLVRTHAATDLDCPDEKILVSEEMGGRYKAVGCGRKAYYRSACEGLTCEVRGEDDPPIPWKDRPEPIPR